MLGHAWFTFLKDHSRCSEELRVMTYTCNTRTGKVKLENREFQSSMGYKRLKQTSKNRCTMEEQSGGVRTP